MNLDFSTQILNPRGQPIPLVADDKIVEGEFETLGTIAEKALLLAIPQEGLTLEDKRRRYKLFQRIAVAEGAIEVSTTELGILKDVIGAGFASPLIVGRAFDILEPEG